MRNSVNSTCFGESAQLRILTESKTFSGNAKAAQNKQRFQDDFQ